MTTTAVKHRHPMVALLVYALRSCIPPKRWVGLMFPCLGAVLFGLLARAIDAGADVAFSRIALNGILGIAVPIAALIVGDAVLGADLRAGTFHLTWLSPTPPVAIVVARWAAGAIVALVTIVPAVAIAAVAGGAPGNAIPIAVAAAAGSISYVALFVAIGAITRRTAVWSLAIVFFVERLLGTALTGIAQLSPTWESRAVYQAFAHGVPTRLIRTGIPQGWGAIGRLAIVSVAMIAVATWRLRVIRLSGPSD